MRVLVNAASARMGGAVTYLQNLLRWLPRVAPEDHFIVYIPAATKAKLASWEGPASVQLEAYPFSDTGGAIRLYFDQMLIPRLVSKHGADVLFSTTGFGTFFSPCPQVLLIRNLAYFDRAFQARYKQLERSLRKNTLRRWHSLLSMRQADVILFPTRAMQDIVEEYLDLGQKRTAAIHYGFDHDAFSANGAVPLAVLDAACRWKEEGYHLLLNVSTYAVQKNFETLIEALPQLKAKGLAVKLLTTISRDRTTDKEEYDALYRRAETLGVKEAIVELGYVPYQQLGMLYQAADVYVFPSFTESFGHTMVEAMASGLPVVAADTPVNREVCGEAGVFFQAYDPTDCAAALIDLLGHPERKSELARASTARARHFSWHRYAEALKEIFGEAARMQRQRPGTSSGLKEDEAGAVSSPAQSA